MEYKEPNSRRDFIKKSAVGLAGFTIVPRYVLGGNDFIAPSDKLTKAVIGVGGMGGKIFPYDGTQVVAICDVDKMLDKGVKTFTEYGELIKLLEADIAHIATPPHWHGKWQLMPQTPERIYGVRNQ